MFKKLLLATDGSPHADRAARATLELAQALDGAHVTIVHVSADAPSRGQLLEANLDIKTLLKDEAHKALEATEKMFDEAGVPYKLEVALGDAAQKIVEIATRGSKDLGSKDLGSKDLGSKDLGSKDLGPMDLIVIGSRGLGTMSAVLLGSVSQRVAHDALCPVMIVK